MSARGRVSALDFLSYAEFPGQIRELILSNRYTNDFEVCRVDGLVARWDVSDLSRELFSSNEGPPVRTVVEAMALGRGEDWQS
jgi:hypothetical protein